MKLFHTWSTGLILGVSGRSMAEHRPFRNLPDSIFHSQALLAERWRGARSQNETKFRYPVDSINSATPDRDHRRGGRLGYASPDNNMEPSGPIPVVFEGVLGSPKGSRGVLALLKKYFFLFMMFTYLRKKVGAWGVKASYLTSPACATVTHIPLSSPLLSQFF